MRSIADQRDSPVKACALSGHVVAKLDRPNLSIMWDLVHDRPERLSPLLRDVFHEAQLPSLGIRHLCRIGTTEEAFKMWSRDHDLAAVFVFWHAVCRCLEEAEPAVDVCTWIAALEELWV